MDRHLNSDSETVSRTCLSKLLIVVLSLRLKVQMLLQVYRIGESMADAVEEIASFIFGMSVGGFLFTLGNYLSFRWHKKLLEPLMLAFKEFFEMMSKSGEKK